jgi:hypothetical protein
LGCERDSRGSASRSRTRSWPDTSQAGRPWVSLTRWIMLVPVIRRPSVPRSAGCGRAHDSIAD